MFMSALSGLTKAATPSSTPKHPARRDAGDALGRTPGASDPLRDRTLGAVALAERLAEGPVFSSTSYIVDGQTIQGFAVSSRPPAPGSPGADEKVATAGQLSPSVGAFSAFLPARYGDPFVAEGDGVRVVVRPANGAPSAAAAETGKVVYRNVYPATDSYHHAGEGRSEEILLLKDGAAPQRFEYVLDRVEGAGVIRQLPNGAILFAGASGRGVRIDAPWVVDAKGHHQEEAARWELGTEEADGTRSLVLVVRAEGLDFPLAVDPSFSSTGAMNQARLIAAAAPLASGKVLVAGGNSQTGPLATAEVYDPATGAWSLTAGPMTEARTYHTATLLPSGLVLVAGGARPRNGPPDVLATAELYDPATDTWSPTGPMNVARLQHTATLLASGKVLVAGGNSQTGALATAEVYDPATGTWTLTAGPMNEGRGAHTATSLSSGQVLLAGGAGSGGNSSTAEVYDPATGTWSPTGPMSEARSNHTATLLPSGLVLAAGGTVFGSNSPAAELYDPATGIWSNTAGPMNEVRREHTAILLSSGRVLVAGGRSADFASRATAELYDPATGIWNYTGEPMNAARSAHTATLLASGMVLLAGGSSTNFAIVGSAELYDPAADEPNTSVTLTALPASPSYGQSVTLAATVASSAGTPTGSVEFFDGATSLGTAPLSGGAAQVTTAALSAGSHSLSAAYTPDSGSFTPASGTTSLAVSPAGTSTVLVSSANPSVLGQTVTFTATVASAGGTPTGSVEFFDGSTSLGTAALSGGVASLSVSVLGGGPHQITASYGGDGNFASGSSPQLAQTVSSQKATATTLASSVNPSLVGQAVTFTATVTAPSGGTPTGSVRFLDGATVLATKTLAGGSASFTKSNLTRGDHSITAQYVGTSAYAASTSDPLAQQVTTTATATTLASSANPAAYGQAVTLTATVTSGSGTPTGNVKFYDGSTLLATKTLSGGTASYTKTNFATGPHSLTAQYVGAGAYEASVSGPLTQQVNQAATSTTLSSSANPSAFGQPVTFTATVSIVAPGVGTPTGAVKFYDGATLLGQASLSGGVATLTRSNLAVTTGTPHAVTAQYVGTASYAPSTSTQVDQVVNAASTTMLLTASPNPAVAGQTVTFTAVVTVTAPGGGTPTGQVQFFDDGVLIATRPLSGGVARLAKSNLTRGSHSMTVLYLGSPNHEQSPLSATLTQVVN
jgi:hypothetical protein